MRNKKQKKAQRVVNKEVKELNKNIYNDSFWLGRFYAKQVWSEYCEYEDHSGGILTIELRFVDKKTNYSKTVRLSYYGNKNFFSKDLWWAMNDFICEDCDVWKEEDLRNNIVDYRKDKR